mgnify:CR=1 FL=1
MFLRGGKMSYRRQHVLSEILLATLLAFRDAGISKDSIFQLIDSGSKFDEIAVYLDQNREDANIVM